MAADFLTAHSYPRLRAIDIRLIDTASQGPGYMLRDPLRLADNYLVVPQAFAPLLMMLDGTTSRADLAALLAAQLGAVSGPALLNELLDALDEALLLDSPRFRAARAEVTNAYLGAPYRPPALAGLSYPQRADELRALFDDLLWEASEVEHSPATIRALLSPHIDYERGGPVYAQVWKSAAAAIRDAECVLVLATDHYGPEQITLTRQNYATPFGVLPTDRAVVEMLAEAYGASDAFAGELYHRNEHSIELVVTWLQHMRCGRACPVVPILCGSFSSIVRGEADPANNRQLSAMLQAIRDVCASRRTVIVISGDMAHVGPAFGTPPLNEQREQALRDDDAALLQAMGAGRAPDFLAEVRRQGDRNNVCGVPPTYLALDILGATQGELVGYTRCSADDQNTSAVTVAGMVFA